MSCWLVSDAALLRWKRPQENPIWRESFSFLPIKKVLRVVWRQLEVCGPRGEAPAAVQYTQLLNQNGTVSIVVPAVLQWQEFPVE